MSSIYFKSKVIVLLNFALLFFIVFSPFYPMYIIAEETNSQIPKDELSSGINTGDALSETEILSEINTNTLEQQIEDKEYTENPKKNTDKDQNLNAPPTNENIDTEIKNINEGKIQNEIQTESNTGENISHEEEATIDTGNAYASANVISVINLNIIESEGLIYFLNNFLKSLGQVDLRPMTESILKNISEGEENSSCEENDCATSLSTQLNNQAKIDNTVIVRSSTGNNYAKGQNGTSIDTGNAYAGVNIANIMNANIIDSNYLVFGFNNFGDWQGDLVFPNSNFFANFFKTNSSSNSNNTTIDNSVNIENNIEVAADTGNNETTGETSNTQTGNALAGSNIANIANSNLINTSKIYMIFRIFGSWDGSVFNTPEGINWMENPKGFTIVSSGENENNASGNTDASVKNSSNITNNVEVFALTGENKISNLNNEANINTGNAYAGANILNIANSNIVSSNWIIALINVFGNWKGNVSFGQPDLWVATKVEESGRFLQGKEITFHTTIANRGDARASNINFTGYFDSKYVHFKKNQNNEPFSLNINNLAAGEIREFSYKAKINDSLPDKEILVNHKFNLSLTETDANGNDNLDTLPFIIGERGKDTPNELFKINKGYRPEISVVKTNSAQENKITVPDKVDYTVKIKNTGDLGFESVLYDVLKDEAGNVVSQNNWELGEILPDEEISLTYTAVFDKNTVPGTYTNYAWVETLGGKYLKNPEFGMNFPSEIATSSVLVEDTEREVLGASCKFHVSRYIHPEIKNNENEVKELQKFLNQEMKLDLPVTGIYDPTTIEAIKAFQMKYSEEVLKPWGIDTPTGIVYQTTRRWINHIGCGEETEELPILVNWSKRLDIAQKPTPIDDKIVLSKNENKISYDVNYINQDEPGVVVKIFSKFTGLLKDIFSFNVQIIGLK